MTFKYKSSALTCDEEIKGITQWLPDEDENSFYGNKHFICETITPTAAKRIAELINQFIVTLHSDKIIQFNFVVE